MNERNWSLTALSVAVRHRRDSFTSADGSKKAARFTAGWFGLIAAVLGVLAALKALTASSNPAYRQSFFYPTFWLVGTAHGCAVFVPGRLNCAGWCCSKHIFALVGRSQPALWDFLTNIFLATMLLVVTVNNAFFFMIFWEMMTLVTYLLGDLAIG